MTDVKVDVLIIGAGPSGSVAAAYLHKKGISTRVVEKSKFPRFVIGESLLPRCMHHFEEVDLLDCLKNQNFEIKRGARFLRGGSLEEFDFAKKHTEGFNWTWQAPRAEFDAALTDELQRRGVDIQFEQEVVKVEFDEQGFSVTEVKTKEGQSYSVHAKFVIDSSGHGRVLPRLLKLDKPSPLAQHSSIFCHVTDRKRPEGKEGSLITFDVIERECWLWVIPFSNGNTSIGYVCTNEFLDSFKGSPPERLMDMMKLSDYYNDRFKDEEFLFEPKILKNHSKSVTKLYGKGFALTGNSAEFLDPVFSSGVTFATESGLLAAKLIAKTLDGDYVDWEKDYSDYIKQGVSVFGTYVREWYSGDLQTIFFDGDTNPEIKKQICAVLAGFVWDESNPFVKKHETLLNSLAHIIKMESQSKAMRA